MPAEGLQSVREDPDAEAAAENTDVQLKWGQQVSGDNWGQQVVLTRRAAAKFKQLSEVKNQNQNPESAYSSATPSRVGTGLSGGTASNASNPQSRTLTIGDQHGNTAEATEESPGNWNVRVFFSRQFALAMQNRSTNTTGIKIASGTLVATGEGMKAAASEGIKSAGKPVKMTGDVGMALTAAMDAAVYGQSAWQTYKTEGLNAALADGRKALFQTFALAATITAATLAGGENSIAKAIAAGAQLMGAASANGPTHQAELAEAELKEMAGMYRLEEGLRAESQSNLPEALHRQDTDLTVLQSNASGNVNLRPLRQGTDLSEVPAMGTLPVRPAAASRTDSEISKTSGRSDSATPPPAMPGSFPPANSNSAPKKGRGGSSR